MFHVEHYEAPGTLQSGGFFNPIYLLLFYWDGHKNDFNGGCDPCGVYLMLLLK